MDQSSARKQAIETWMLAVTKDGGVERLDDLHIDRIDPDWRRRERWIDAALAAHRIALDLRRVRNLPVTVAVAFSLKSGTSRRGIDFRTLPEMHARLDETPPSLYLFWRGNEPWIDSGDFQKLETPIAGGQVAELRWWYTEFKPEDSKRYHRSVFCEG
jgi:hypothetical protein